MNMHLSRRLPAFLTAFVLSFLVTGVASAEVMIRVDFDGTVQPSGMMGPINTQAGWDSLVVGNRYAPASIPMPISPTNGDGSTMGYHQPPMGAFTASQRDRTLAGMSFPAGFEDLLRDFHFLAIPLEIRGLPAGQYELTLYAGDPFTPPNGAGESNLSIDILDMVGGIVLNTLLVTLPDLTSIVTDINDVRVTTLLDLAAGNVIRISGVNPSSTSNPVSGLELTSVEEPKPRPVPEPASIAIWSLLGLALATRVRRRR